VLVVKTFASFDNLIVFVELTTGENILSVVGGVAVKAKANTNPEIILFISIN
jgi:hypothetical protein